MKTQLKALLLGTALLWGSQVIAADGPGPFSKQVPAGARDRVYVSNLAGSVVVSTWDRPEVDVQATLGADVERVDVQRISGQVDVRVIADEKPWYAGRAWGGREDVAARVQIRVPVGTQLEVKTVSAQVEVTGVRGRLRLTTVSGSIHAELGDADVQAKTVSGAIRLEGAALPATVRASSVSGSVTLLRTAGEAEVRSTSGALDVQMEKASDVRLHTVSGSVVFRGVLAPEGVLEADSVSGSLRLDARAPAGYEFQMRSYSGSVKSCHGDQAWSAREGGRGERLEGVRGEGRGSIRAKTHSGSISLCDR